MPTLLHKLLSRLLRYSFFALLCLCLLAALCLAYAQFVEPRWLAVRVIRLAQNPSVAVIHISDLHYKGDAHFLSSVVARINALHADAVCFTGDLAEDAQHLSGCLSILAQINKPLFGVPGNHDRWSRAQQILIESCFASTRGKWLADAAPVSCASNLLICAPQHIPTTATASPSQPVKRILLTHYPGTILSVPTGVYALVLAGHTHGGQVRLPFVHSSLLSNTDIRFLHGLFHTPAGPLHVSAGVGTYLFPLRFRSRPEITLILF